MLKFKSSRQCLAPPRMWISGWLLCCLAVWTGLGSLSAVRAEASPGAGIDTQLLAEPQLDLAGSSWQVIELRGRPVFSVQALTLTFEAPGRLFGHSGCNAYAASYVQHQTQLYVADVRHTLRECTSPQAAQNEREFLRMLESTREAKRDPEGKLVIFSTQGTFLAAEIR